MRAQNNNINAVPPSSTSLNQDHNRINLPKNISLYRAFLYSEAKRKSSRPINIEHIDQFINSPDGQRGLALFLSTRVQPKDSARPKAVGEVLGSSNEELERSTPFGARYYE